MSSFLFIFPNNKTHTNHKLASPSPPEKFGHTSLFSLPDILFNSGYLKHPPLDLELQKTHLMKKSGGLSDMCPCALMACQHQRAALIFCNAGSD